MIKNKIIIFFIFFSIFSYNSNADVIFLKNGNKIKTSGSWEDGELIKYYSFDGVIGIPKNTIKRIKKEKNFDENNVNVRLSPKIKKSKSNKNIVIIPNYKNYDLIGYVKYISDGDTIILRNGKKIRYIGINTPEIAHRNKKGEPYGQAAKKFNKKLVNGKKVFIIFDSNKFDQYGRILGYIFLKDGTFINARMIEEGYAYCLYYFPNIKHSNIFLKLQRKAMSQKKGIWHKGKGRRQRLIGNKKSFRFHLSTCRFGKKTGKKNRKNFNTKWDAFWEGYAPCKKCISGKNLF
ncbi:micrococcal nuclease [Candidatus Magnetomoraceae bacterium gMMP-15]